MIQVVLRNAAHPDYGEATIPFPMPEEEYGHCLELLEALEIGNAVSRDCKVQEIQEGPPILKRLEGSRVNLDELDYLAKRLDIGAVEVLYAREAKEQENPAQFLAEKEAEYTKLFANPYNAIMCLFYSVLDIT